MEPNEDQYSSQYRTYDDTTVLEKYQSSAAEYSTG